MGSPLRSPPGGGQPAATESAPFSAPPNPSPPRLIPPAREEDRSPVSSRSLKDSPELSPVRDEEEEGSFAVNNPVVSLPKDAAAREGDGASHVPRLSSLLRQESPAWSPPRGDGRPADPVATSPQKGVGRPATAEAVEKPPFGVSSIVNRAARDEPPAVTKVERGAGGTTRGDGTETERRFSVASWIARHRQREDRVVRAAAGVRLSAVVLSTVSFSVMAADKNKGWAEDSFDRYKEYRFCITMNVLVFVYSGFQAYAQSHRLIYGKDIILPPLRYYFDFVADQVLAYLLLAASSAAATRTDGWVSYWGGDPFPTMANWSAAISFLTFVAVAVSALISARNLFAGRA